MSTFSICLNMPRTFAHNPDEVGKTVGNLFAQRSSVVDGRKN
jgi:hypothetical protein